MEIKEALKQLSIYNTLTRKKELFKPINYPNVGLYVCGPTVYSEAHIGNVRTFVTFDVVFRYLTFLGHKVRYVRNITDVGHLVDDIDEGEDKIAKRARLEQLEPMEIVQKYTNNFHDVMLLFNAIPPSIEPTATAHLIDQIEMVNRILKNGFAYEVNGSVYFDVEKYNKQHPYGALSGRKIEDLIANTRDLDGQSDKKSPLDFAIWKKAEKGHIMRWPSPWGDGFPGWHLECSVMSTKYLGQTFDIHGGGMDLKFPHHECEIAQSVGADGKEPVRYWMHGNMLTFEGSKMSKSLGNTFTPLELVNGDHELLEQGYSPMTVRFFMFQSHYASTLDFSNEALKAAEKGYSRLTNSLNNLNNISYKTGNQNPEKEEQVNKLIDSLFLEMNDDFNTAKAIAVLFELSSIINSFYDEKIQVGEISEDTFNRLKTIFNAFIFDVLGLKVESNSDNSTLDQVMEVLIGLRQSARENKDWALADRIRDELAKANIQIKDEKGKTTYGIIK
jgi:cysteinyl-tRNA synthetase